MWFNSIPFLWLFALTFAAYYAVKQRTAQIVVLLVASFVFYAWSSPQLLFLLSASILLNAFTSYKVGLLPVGKSRALWATLGVVVNLLILGFFKYGGLLASTLGQLLDAESAASMKALLTLPLPIGISFYTFEGISLLVDTWKGKVKPQADGAGTGGFTPHLLRTSLFVAFFPHLVAGPILKANHFLPQIGAKRFQDISWITVVRLLVAGYFLKTVVADNLKDFTFWLSYPHCLRLGSVNGLVLVFGYSIQIFADFAGYSWIAIGLGAAFGYELPANFNYPYIATSLRDFWRRWHISLSTWLRDYLYFPLGGNRGSKVRTYFNLFVVMALGGLWHGAAWSYLIWGCYHGLGLALERAADELIGERLAKINAGAVALALVDCVRVVAVFLFVTGGWLLFKLTDIRHAYEFLGMVSVKWNFPLNTHNLCAVALYSLPVLAMHVVHLPGLSERWTSLRARKPSVDDWLLALMLVGLIINRGSSNEFVYFQF